jgi:hypothetical protein
MWKIKELKYKARQVVRKNYWTAIVVCFLIALLTGEFGTSIIGIWQSEDSIDPNYVINSEKIITEHINKEKVQEAKERTSGIDKIKDDLNDIEIKVWDIITANLNNITKSQKYIFKIWDAVESFRINEIALGIQFLAIAAIAFIFTIVIADPLIVAGKRYFIKARQSSNTRIGEIGEIFKKGNWLNVGITMFLRNIYTWLWYLTIIGGIIKRYEYRMIPYILAENPKIKIKEAFKLSKEMMKGNKFKAFLLDLSFIGWSIVSLFTFGLLNILYVNPYKSATKAELYMVLRNNAIEKKYEYYEELNDKTLK